MAAEELWIGTLRKLVPRLKAFGVFDPVARFEGNRWNLVSEAERKGRFPKGAILKEGTETAGQHPGTYWLFRCNGTATGEERSTARSPQRAQSLIDLSGTSLDTARRMLFDRGLQLPHNGNSAVVLLAEGLCAFLKFDRETSQDPWRARLPPDGIVELLRAEPEWSGVDPDRKVPFLPRSIDARDLVSAKTVSWLSDDQFLALVLRQMEGSMSAYRTLFADPDPSGRRAMHVLAETLAGLPDAAEGQALMARLRSGWSKASKSLPFLGDLSKMLVETDAGRGLLARAVERRASEATLGIEVRLEAELQAGFTSNREALETANKQVGLLSTRKGALEAELCSLDDRHGLVLAETARLAVVLSSLEDRFIAASARLVEAERRATEAERALSSAESARDVADTASRAIARHLGSFAETARQAFEATGASNESAVATLAGRLQGWLEAAGHEAGSFLPPTAPPWSAPTPAADVAVIQVAALPERLAQEAEFHGLVADDLLLLDAFARAGEPVLLAGAAAEPCLRAYARAVTGGEIRVHAVDPATIGLDDLWRSPASERPSALALGWNRARANEHETVLVCLRDVDAAPFRLWLSSFLSASGSDARPRNLLLVMTAGALESDEGMDIRRDDPARALAALVPRFVPGAVSRFAMCGQEEAPTCLVPKKSAGVPVGIGLSLAGFGHTPAAVRRALRVAEASGGEAGATVVREAIDAWAAFLSGDEMRRAPAALGDGLQALARLRDTR